LEGWDYNKNNISELDWNEQITLDSGFIAYAVPARHFSGRTLKRNKTLWASFVLQTPPMKIFISGDGGYDNHCAETGKTIGPTDLAILDSGSSTIFRMVEKYQINLTTRKPLPQTNSAIVNPLRKLYCPPRNVFSRDFKIVCKVFKY
jgi:L-ascorbate metabolism protein UlaG (beta-lactamase superfamily)